MSVYKFNSIQYFPGEKAEVSLYTEELYTDMSVYKHIYVIDMVIHPLPSFSLLSLLYFLVPLCLPAGHHVSSGILIPHPLKDRNLNVEKPYE